MNIISPRIAAALLLLNVLMVGQSLAQTRHAPAAPPKAAARTTPKEPPPTYDTLFAADTYKIYSEIRGVGQLIRSSGMNDALDPMMRLAAPPKEFRTLLTWLNNHADAVMNSRMMCASWPVRPRVPEFVCAIEFLSPEEAAKFEPELNQFLPKLFPTQIPSASPEASPHTNQRPAAQQKPPELPYVIQHSGTLVLISDSPVAFKALRPAGSKLLAEKQNFRIAHDRFASEPIFIFFDIEVTDRRNPVTPPAPAPSPSPTVSVAAQPKEGTHLEVVQVDPPASSKAGGGGAGAVKEATLEAMPTEPTNEVFAPTSQAQSTPQPQAEIGSLLGRLVGSTPSVWPEAIGAAIAFDSDSYVVRTLFLNAENNKGIILPFVPQVVSGPPITPASPSIMPADTEILFTASLDYSQIYENVGKSLSKENEDNRGISRGAAATSTGSPFAPYERLLGINLKDDLIPLLGNEIAVSIPLKTFESGGRQSQGPNAKSDADAKQKGTAAFNPTPFVAISIKDREAVKQLLPKLLNSLGIKGGNALGQTESKDDTELVTFGDAFSYAFIGDFLILSTESATVRHVVDSYINHETLASDSHFHNATRWEPRQVLGQVYVSPALVDSYSHFDPTASLNDKMVEFLLSLGPSAEPVTYALTNEGMGPLHELHVPKKLIMLMFAGMSGPSAQSPVTVNQRVAQSSLRTVSSAEATYQATTGDGKYGSFEDLVTANLINRDIQNSNGYRIDLIVYGDRFEATATPKEYGKSGTLSFFLDESGVLRGGDHGGGPSTVADKPVD